MAGSHCHVEVDAAPVLVLIAEVVRRLNLEVRLSELVRDDVVQTRHGIAAAARQSRIGRGDDVVDVPVVDRIERLVSAHVVTVEPALVPLHLCRDPRCDLLLNRDADLIVPRPQPMQDLIAVGERLIQRAEVRVRQAAADVAACRPRIRRSRRHQIAVDDLVAVRVGPAPERCCDDAGGRRGAGVDAVVLRGLNVFAEVHLQRRLASAEHVVGEARARQHVEKVRAVLVRNVRVRNEARAAD